jgi:DNA-binding MarR family transcriptional regulator
LSPSLTRIIKSFVDDGMIIRIRSHEDQRITLLSLSDKAKKLVSEFRPDVDAGYKQLIDQLGEKKLKELSALLEEVIKLSPPNK